MDRVSDHIDCDIIIWSRSPAPIHSFHLSYNPHWPDYCPKVLNSNFQEFWFWKSTSSHRQYTCVWTSWLMLEKKKEIPADGICLNVWTLLCQLFGMSVVESILLIDVLGFCLSHCWSNKKKCWSAVNDRGFVCVLAACVCEVGTFPSIIWCVSVPKHQANSSEAFRVWELIIYTSKEFGKGCLYYWRHSLQ